MKKLEQQYVDYHRNKEKSNVTFFNDLESLFDVCACQSVKPKFGKIVCGKIEDTCRTCYAADV